MLVVWLLLTLNLVLVHCSEVQQPVPICEKDLASDGKCITEPLGNTTTSTTPSTTTLSSTPNPLTTELPSSNSSASTRSPLANASEPKDSGGQIFVKPQTDEETARNSSSGIVHGRAMNFDVQEHQHQPPDSHAAKSSKKESLQDLSLDDIDEMSILPTQIFEDKTNTTMINATAPSPFLSNSTTAPLTSTESPVSTTVPSNASNFTMVNGSSCVQGQKFDRGCIETCECGFDGKAICRPRCSMPFFRRGAGLKDPACIERPTEDPCCSLLACTQDTETEPLEGCTYKNQSYQRGDTINDGCFAVCTCGEAGQVLCKPRCPAVHNNSSSDRCVELPDPTDPCCTVVLCDVTLGEHDVNKAGVEDATGSPHLQLLTVEVVNRTTARLGLAGELQYRHENLTVETSQDQKTWKQQDAQGLLVPGLEPGRTYYLRVKSGSMVSNTVEVSLPTTEPQHSGTAGCQYKDHHYAYGEEFHDGCESYCACTDSGVQCASIECPTDFGLDVLDPSCVDWETHPPDFKPSPPYCCPEQVRCKNNGSCEYEGQHFNNWAEIPVKPTGCATKKCYCEYGNVSCQSTCPPVPHTPPSDLQCEPHEAILSHLPGDDCCSYWLCPQLQHSGSNVTVMHDRPTEQRQPANNISTYDESSDQHLGPITPAGVAVKSEHKHTFLPLNPDYMPPSLLPFLEPLEHDDEHPSHNHSMNNVHTFKEKGSNSKDGPNKFPGDHKPTQPIPIKTSNTPHDIDSIHITTATTTTTETSKSLENKEQERPESSEKPRHPEHKEVYKTEGKLEPYHVKPPFLPEYEETLGDSEQPIMWTPPRDHDGNSKHGENTRHSDLNKPPVDNPRYGAQNHLSPGEYFVPPNRRPLLGPGEVLQVPSLTGSPEIRQQKPSPGHQVDSASDPHLDQILMHLQKQGILPEHYTIVQQEGPPSHRDIPQQHRIQSPSQPQGSQKRPDNTAVYESDSDDIPVHLPTGRVPPQYNQGYVPKSIPRPEQLPSFYQPGISRPQPNDARNVSPYPLDSNKYPNQPGRQPDTDGPPVAHIPYQGLLLPHQYHGLSYVPPHVDIDHLLLTSQGRHNQSQPGFLEQPLPSGFPVQGPVSRNQDEISVHVLEAVDEHTVKLVFSVSPVLVGLHGRVELRYTSDVQNSDPSTWDQQVFAPPDDLIATPQLEFELGDLIPDTQYKIKVTVILRDLHNSPTSKILSVRTPPAAAPITTLPPQIPLDVGLSVVDVNATWARLMWRKFTEFELQFIDGVQLRYKEKEGKVYAATPLIHRAVTSYMLGDLRPHTEYEVRIFLIPFPGQTTELIAERTTELLTAEVHDLYKFNVTLDLQHIKSTSVELSWTGVPYPEDKYVNIFRAIYQSDAGKEDFSTFKVAKRDSQARTVIQDLKPGTRYRLWLEVYLTNGRIKKSNVQDFITKPGSVPSVGATQQGKLKGEDPEPLVETADYYGPLVAVAIIAALAIVAALILLLILMKKHGHNKAAISATRKSQSAYDNPSYKTSDNDPASAANGGSATKTVEQP